eukprot:gnl/Carplike_NY0171/804_a1105_1000.p1 GENE.gnl/Carplike_NY0171/804_a1105_1000~~gnl/Carplike_NY0171/804_a1105_1000.p1  ORF type:complete len:133 (-),score=15.21 gnl/Carplike_NY0171/804_a1105_1000:248-646(-)
MNNLLTDFSNLSLFSTLTNLEKLNISSNLLLSNLPNLSQVPLNSLGISSTSIILEEDPNTTLLLPSSIKSLFMSNTPNITQEAFDVQVGANNLTSLELISMGLSSNSSSQEITRISSIKFLFNLFHLFFLKF